ncbi:type VI secretion system protein ImpM [Amphritea atlantica]|uniref:Type VI secretion system protein ImpM n=1 Tax=Amphritea atlantica TaxID=355243 RepID=A0A1H9MCB5_9GAMM|nr:type VI secretion system-associated protein TagF [Amphritea atlantica]SER21087.1 type VI secretion system protein ImpM [Amphritea atlantica]
MATVQSGFYGKVPCKGDFVSRGLSRECIGNLDRWLQQGMTSSKAYLGDSWTGHYMIAPVWQFYVSPGVLDPHGWLGVFIPSIDSVGRKFPSLVAVPVLSPLVCLKQLEDQEELLLQIEALLFDSLEDHFDFPLFCHQVINLKLLPSYPSVDLYRAVKPVAVMQNLQQHRDDLRHLDLKSEYSRPAVWWSEGSETIQPQLWLSDGLPDASQFRFFLTGK